MVHLGELDMRNEIERGEALELLSAALARVLQIGIEDLPPAARDLAAERVGEDGCRVQFTISVAPLQLECRLISGSSGAALFKIETEVGGSAAAH